MDMKETEKKKLEHNSKFIEGDFSLRSYLLSRNIVSNAEFRSEFFKLLGFK